MESKELKSQILMGIFIGLVVITAEKFIEVRGSWDVAIRAFAELVMLSILAFFIYKLLSEVLDVHSDKSKWTTFHIAMIIFAMALYLTSYYLATLCFVILALILWFWMVSRRWNWLYTLVKIK